jgi:hypothetical protein
LADYDSRGCDDHRRPHENKPDEEADMNWKKLSTVLAFAVGGALAGTAVWPSVSSAQSPCSYSKGSDDYGCVCTSGSAYTSCSNPPPLTCGDCSVGDFCCC